jgi:hypothetical protein
MLVQLKTRDVSPAIAGIALLAPAQNPVRQHKKLT